MSALARDLASFHNIAEGTALAAINAARAGDPAMVRALGVAIPEGLRGDAAEAVIVEQSQAAMGDFDRGLG